MNRRVHWRAKVGSACRFTMRLPEDSFTVRADDVTCKACRKLLGLDIGVRATPHGLQYQPDMIGYDKATGRMIAIDFK